MPELCLLMPLLDQPDLVGHEACQSEIFSEYVNAYPNMFPIRSNSCPFFFVTSHFPKFPLNLFWLLLPFGVNHLIVC